MTSWLGSAILGLPNQEDKPKRQARKPTMGQEA